LCHASDTEIIGTHSEFSVEDLSAALAQAAISEPGGSSEQTSGVISRFEPSRVSAALLRDAIQ
jgi:hypothetical protein